MHLMNFPEDSSAVIQPAFYANTHLFYYSFVFEDTEEVESFLRFTVLLQCYNLSMFSSKWE